MTIAEYVTDHCHCGPCQCPHCLPKATDPDFKTPEGHVANLSFFKLALKGEPDKQTLLDLIAGHKGVHTDVDLFDGDEHGYIEIGAWLDSQNVALMLMGVGHLMGLWELRTPHSMMPGALSEEVLMALAGQGLVTIQASDAISARTMAALAAAAPAQEAEWSGSESDGGDGDGGE